MKIHGLTTLLLVVVAAEIVNAEPQCVATSDVATTCDPAPTSECEACNGFSTNETACDVLTCTWTSAGCSDDCNAKDETACTTASTTCDWNVAASCQDGCDGLQEDSCDEAAGCDWNAAVPGECSPPADCTTTDQTECTNVGCTWTPGPPGSCGGTPTTTCDGFITQETCLDGCEWTPGSDYSCVNSGTCSGHSTESPCNAAEGCLWISASSCTNKEPCNYKDATDCGADSNGCTYIAESSCSDVASTTACTDHTTQNACCTDADGCAWVECAGDGSGRVMPSLLLLLLLPINLLTRF